MFVGDHYISDCVSSARAGVNWDSIVIVEELGDERSVVALGDPNPSGLYKYQKPWGNYFREKNH